MQNAFVLALGHGNSAEVFRYCSCGCSHVCAEDGLPFCGFRVWKPVSTISSFPFKARGVPGRASGWHPAPPSPYLGAIQAWEGNAGASRSPLVAWHKAVPLLSLFCHSYLYQIAHLGDDDDEPEFSSAMPLEEGDTFFFQPRPLKNLVLVDELDSLSPILSCQVRGSSTWIFAHPSLCQAGQLLRLVPGLL